MSGDKFNISKEEAELFSGKNGLVQIPSLGGLINISSIVSILPVEIANQNSDRKQNRDGQWCIRKFGQWYLENNPDVRVDLNYYPELKNKEVKSKYELIENSPFAKQLSGKF